jgi:hypothetical protein
MMALRARKIWERRDEDGQIVGRIAVFHVAQPSTPVRMFKIVGIFLKGQTLLVGGSRKGDRLDSAIIDYGRRDGKAIFWQAGQSVRLERML